LGAYPKNLVEAFTQASKYLVAINVRAPQYSQPTEAVFIAQSKQTTQHKKPAQQSSRQEKRSNPHNNNTVEKKQKSKGSGEGKRGKGACHLCAKKGHFMLDCPLLQECKAIIAERNDGDEVNVMHVMDEGPESIVLVNNRGSKHFERFDVLLDNQASTSVFKERTMLENIRTSMNAITIKGIGGSLEVTEEGDHEHFGTIAFSEDALANVLSFSKVRMKYRVHYDHIKDTFIVHINDSIKLTFANRSGLYICRMRPTTIKESVAVATTSDN